MARTQKDFNCTMINLKKMKINKLLPIQVVKVWSVVQEVRHDVGTFKVVGGWGVRFLMISDFIEKSTRYHLRY